MTHFQPWIDRTGEGYSIFDYSQYKSTCQRHRLLRIRMAQARSQRPAGRLPHARPVLSAALRRRVRSDRHGKTVLRGGWGRYYYHSGQFTSGLDVAAGVQTVQPAQQYQRSAAAGAQPFDRSTLPPRRSLRRRWTARTISSRIPTATASPFRSEPRGPACWKSPTSATRAMTWPLSSGAGSNINLVPVGAMLASKNGGVDPNSLNANNFRPLLGSRI